MQTATSTITKLQNWVKQLPWVSLSIFVIAQNIIWWSYPLHYGQMTNGTFHFNQLLLFAYTVAVSLASFLMFQANFRSLWAHVPILVSLILAFSGIIRGNLEILIMLLMFSGFWFVIEMRWLKLQNVWGLIVYSLLATFPISCAIFFFQNHYLSTTFLINLLPLFACQLFFMTPIFETNPKRRQLTLIITGIFLIAVILVLRRSLLGVCGIALVVLTVLFNINFANLKQRYVAPIYICAELITTLLLVYA